MSICGDYINSSIKDKEHLLGDEEMTLLHDSLIQVFNLCEYKNLDQILEAIRSSFPIIIDPAEPANKDVKKLPPELEKAKEFWGERIHECPGDIFARLMFEQILGEIGTWKSSLIFGLYSRKNKEIRLFPNNMKKKYVGIEMQYVLVSTLVHEIMHAFFDRKPLDAFPYVYSLEEPMAEFGMLLFLKETGQTDNYNWAEKYVGSKQSCYRYGVALMKQCESEGRYSRTRRDLELYKVILPTFFMTMKPYASMTTVKTSSKYEVVDKKTKKLLATDNAMTKIVLFVIRDYCLKKKPKVTLAQLQTIFAGTHHSPGKNIIESSKSVAVYKASHPKDKTPRYMEGDPITLADGETIMISNQWAGTGDKENFSKFKDVADSLGYEIK